jgi:hypothetical protein
MCCPSTHAPSDLMGIAIATDYKLAILLNDIKKISTYTTKGTGMIGR